MLEEDQALDAESNNPGQQQVRRLAPGNSGYITQNDPQI